MAQRFYGVKDHPDQSKNGVYDNWGECSAVVQGAKGVHYKGFPTRDEAEAFCSPGEKSVRAELPQAKPVPVKAAQFDAARARDAVDYLRRAGLMDDTVARGILARVDEKSAGIPAQDAPLQPSVTGDGIVMYVDGSYNDRSQQCGFGVHIMGVGRDMRGQGPEYMMYGSVPHSSGGRNIEGEVTAAWVGLEKVRTMAQPGTPVTVYHDYEGVGKWPDGDWRANKDYTSAYADLVRTMRLSGMDIRFEHVKGHTGVEGNETVDKLAKMGCGVHFADEAAFADSIRRVPGTENPIVMRHPVHEPVAKQSEWEQVGMNDIAFGEE